MWWYVVIAIGLAVSTWLGWLLRNKPDYVSKGWVNDHHSTSHEHEWRDR